MQGIYLKSSDASACGFGLLLRVANAPGGARYIYYNLTYLLIYKSFSYKQAGGSELRTL